MPAKVCVSVSRKVGMPRYGSLGATCQIECELESGALHSTMAAFHAEAKRLYGAAAQAVDSELSRQQEASHAAGAKGVEGSQVESPCGCVANTPFPRTERPATPAQLRMIQALVRTHDVDLDEILAEIFEVGRVEDLCVEEASRLIRQLQT